MALARLAVAPMSARSVRAGVAAAGLLAGVYVAVVGGASGLDHLAGQARADWYLLVPILAGFGVQVALMAELRQRRRQARLAAAATGGAAGTSAVGMVACCAHHVADLAPLAGLTGAARRGPGRRAGRLHGRRAGRQRGRGGAGDQASGPGVPTFAEGAGMHTRVLVAIGVLVLAVGGIAIWLARSDDRDARAVAEPSAGFAARTVRAGTVQIAIQPLRLDRQGAAFQITLTTHSGALDIDLVRHVRLTVDGVAWGEASWSGSPLGGHHRQGILRFAPVKRSDAARSASLRIDGLSSPVEATWQLASASP